MVRVGLNTSSDRSDESTSILGISAHRSKALRFARSVDPAPALPKTYRNAAVCMLVPMQGVEVYYHAPFE